MTKEKNYYVKPIVRENIAKTDDDLKLILQNRELKKFQKEIKDKYK